ncbi:MAG: sensor histidine kinase [Calditrichaeota bacterium]|nr:MAG: sensor histidine kinase [Calditrichota bacterium]
MKLGKFLNTALIISRSPEFVHRYSELLKEGDFHIQTLKSVEAWRESPEQYGFDLCFVDNRQGDVHLEPFLKAVSQKSPHALIVHVGYQPPKAAFRPPGLFHITPPDNHIDITHLIRFLDDLFKRNKMRTELAAMLIHDIRSPFNSLLSYIELLLNETFGPLNEGQQKFLEKAMLIGDQTLDMLEDINEIYLSEQHMFTLDTEVFPVTEVIDQALMSLWIQADQKNMKIRKEIPAGLPPIKGDAFQIQRVFTNLIGNAIKYCPENSTVIIKATQTSEQFAQFEISDNGGGIPESELGNIFRRSYRVKNSHLSRKGEGLGLYICKLIVKAHGGGIRAENNHMGGVSFIFSLPLATDSQEGDTAWNAPR